MTDTEFYEWLEGYKRAFPETANWLNGLGQGKSADDAMAAKGQPIPPSRQRDMLQTWRFALADIGKDEARKVTAEMVLGNAPSVPAFERERTATIVRQNALEARRRDFTPEPDLEPIPSRKTREAGVSLAALLREMTDTEGLTREQKAEILARAFPAKSGDKRDWYRCRTCRDTGKVDVWHPDYVATVMEHGFAGTRTRYSAVASCTCDAGAPFRNRKNNPLPVLNVLHHCRCAFGDVTDQGNVNDLIDWIETRKERFVKERGDPLLAAYGGDDF
jgi:hypothetical protein